jgi:hypothetical protein
MMHGPEHEERLQRLLASDPAARSDSAAELEACETCRAELARLLGCEQELVRMAGVVRADWQVARESTDERDRELVRAGLLREVQRRRNRRLTLFTLAAALLLVIALVPRFRRDAGTATEEFLLGGSIPLLAPLGAGDGERYAEFAWVGELRPRTYYRLIFQRQEDGLRGTEVGRISGLQATRWNPTPEEERALPSPLIWRVEWVDATTEEILDHGEGLARR